MEDKNDVFGINGQMKVQEGRNKDILKLEQEALDFICECINENNGLTRPVRIDATGEITKEIVPNKPQKKTL